ncbi:MAG: hypothetical protein H0S85_10910 [Desulfovibrionaceae bacterium]|jgi:hypothetical protein|nr:hypothetical protein [Desulfovibrionaceae bacterium]
MRFSGQGRKTWPGVGRAVAVEQISTRWAGRRKWLLRRSGRAVPRRSSYWRLQFDFFSFPIAADNVAAVPPAALAAAALVLAGADTAKAAGPGKCEDVTGTVLPKSSSVWWGPQCMRGTKLVPLNLVVECIETGTMRYMALDGAITAKQECRLLQKMTRTVLEQGATHVS